MSRLLDGGMGRLAAGASRSSVGVFSNVLLLGWLLTGPAFHWSDAYMLVGNTYMSAVAYVLLFAVLNTQSRDGAALHAKIDELIRVTADARNVLIGAEQHTEEEIAALRAGIASP